MTVINKMKYKLILEVLDIKDSNKETIEVINSQLLRELPAAPLASSGEGNQNIV
jgi:hypothetical protein